MTLNPAVELGRTIGALSQAQDNLQDQVSPNDPGNVAPPIVFDPSIVIGGGGIGINSFKAIKWFLATDSFVIDHPVYGDIDSSTLKIDGGYQQADLLDVPFPLTYPIVWTDDASPSELAFTSLF